MAEPLIDAYATALFGVASAQGDVDEVADELFRFARVLEANDEFRNALSDPHLPASKRQQIVEDVLKAKATDTTTALVS
ncbi:MAG TPA: F0F1 ATP synthase subunit delta, partial [Acidimicrobiales bacterium]|nr:F0F1 ATP synthase subunit delta [Acidimicrobiales bacterium]